MTSEKTFEEINEFVSGRVIREVYTPQSEYPQYFLVSSSSVGQKKIRALNPDITFTESSDEQE